MYGRKYVWNHNSVKKENYLISSSVAVNTNLIISDQDAGCIRLYINPIIFN